MTATNIAYPFRTIPQDMIECSQWSLIDTSDVMPLLTKIEHWDYDTKIKLERSISFNAIKCLKSLGLDNADTKLKLIVIVVTGPTGSRWVGYQKEINYMSNFSNGISFEIDSEKLAGAITLITEITLVDAGTNSEKLSATKPGSRLWTETHKIDIEGISARFPMDILDFEKSLASLGISLAPWYLQWNVDHLESNFVGNVVLYLNSKQKGFIEKVQTEDPVVIQWLRLDLIRQMCSVAIEQDDFKENFHGYQDGSIGGTIRDWIILAFENMSIEVISAMYQSQRSRFESSIASVFGGEDV